MALGNTLIDYGGPMKRAVVNTVDPNNSAITFTFTHNGKTYKPGDTFNVAVGDIIIVNWSGTNSYTYGYLRVNGTTVAQGYAVTPIAYSYTVQNSVNITFSSSYNTSSGYKYYWCYIADSTAEVGFERSIAEGKCLVGYDGTQIKATINITASYQQSIKDTSSMGYILHDGNTYAPPTKGNTTTINVNIGDTIQVVLPKYYSSGYYGGKIYYNDELVASKDYNYYTGTIISYSLVVGRNLDIAFEIPQNTSIVYAYITNSDTSTGPVYRIFGGKTLINGVSYSVGKQAVTVNMSAASYTGASCVIDGVTYNKSNVVTGLKVKTGDIITFYARGSSGTLGTYNGYITIDGTTVAQTSGYGSTSYEWEVPTGITLIKISFTHTSGTDQGSVVVTTS